jgi:hypothetical protein
VIFLCLLLPRRDSLHLEVHFFLCFYDRFSATTARKATTPVMTKKILLCSPIPPAFHGAFFSFSFFFFLSSSSRNLERKARSRGWKRDGSLCLLLFLRALSSRVNG